ncbi:MAG: FtsQ-type POTRA domain-containing protein [Christensenellaceae bacterium]|jgi:cell division protein FtsQ|nr:FtsQ-type POTRA domain-containing protein [Christensenellaceae bacterium]
MQKRQKTRFAKQHSDNKPTGRRKRERGEENAGQPSIDLARIRARYGARALEPLQEEAQAAEKDILFVDAETLTKEQLLEQLHEQAQTQIEGEEVSFTGEELSVLDGADKPPKRKKRKRAKHKSRPEPDALGLVDFSRPRKKVRVKRGTVKMAALLICVALMLGLLAALYAWMQIDSIEINGCQTLDKAEVRTLAGINEGEQILLVNTAKARERLLQSPYIRSAAVTRLYPNKLIISIAERKPVAAIVSGGNYAIIDDQGYVLSLDASYGELPQAYGVGAAGVQIGQKLGDADNFNSAILLDIVRALRDVGLLNTIQSIDTSQPLSIRLITRTGYAVHVGQPEDIPQKLAKLSAVLREVQRLGYVGGTIDVAAQGDPVYSPPAAALPDPAQEEGTQPEAEGEITPNAEGTPTNALPTPPPPVPSGEQGFSG